MKMYFHSIKMALGKMRPGKISPGKIPLGKVAPGKLLPRKIAHLENFYLPLKKKFCEASSCYGIF